MPDNEDTESVEFLGREIQVTIETDLVPPDKLYYFGNPFWLFTLLTNFAGIESSRSQ